MQEDLEKALTWCYVASSTRI